MDQARASAQAEAAKSSRAKQLLWATMVAVPERGFRRTRVLAHCPRVVNLAFKLAGAEALQTLRKLWWRLKSRSRHRALLLFSLSPRAVRCTGEGAVLGAVVRFWNGSRIRDAMHCQFVSSLKCPSSSTSPEARQPCTTGAQHCSHCSHCSMQHARRN